MKLVMLRFGLALAASLAVACGQTPASEPPSRLRPVVARSGSEYSVHWPGNRASIPIYAGSSADTIDRSQPVATLVGNSVSISGMAAHLRPFFELETSTGALVVAERLIPLEGASNFRDLGGYPTADGRHVRWGRVFRSDALADLSDADVERLGQLGIRLVCDFRGPRERQEEPDRLPSVRPPRVEFLEIHDDTVDVTAIEERIRAGDFEGVDFVDLLVQGNRSFIENFSDRYARMFERLGEAGNLPALVHCTGGKDRAGLASALILFALGVSEELVFEDFLLTNVYTAAKIERALTLIRVASLFRTDPEVVRPLLEVRREYLQSALDAIQEHYASVENYLREGLGVDDATRDALRAKLLH